MPLDDEKRKRLIRALFVNLDGWVETALRIADPEEPNPRGLALNHARNLMQCRQALQRLMHPDDHASIPQPDVNRELVE